MMRIGLGLSVCDRCGSVVYQPTTTTTTTTTAAAASTTLYLTDTANALGGTDLSETHDVTTFAATDGSIGNYYWLIQPFNTATWGTWGGEFKVKITGTITCEFLTLSLIRNNSSNAEFPNLTVEVPIAVDGAGTYTFTIPLTNWDTPPAEGSWASDDIFYLALNNDAVETDSFAIDCTLATDTYLTLDAELDPQPWPAVTTTTTT